MNAFRSTAHHKRGQWREHPRRHQTDRSALADCDTETSKWHETNCSSSSSLVVDKETATTTTGDTVNRDENGSIP